ncbi:sensor histidine kinase [Flavobacteriaceae bacterium S356]|uniref:Sensor histidine kinase n=1 Tax=Asprobacillus argus TaxID=3076534 RepID=A0ABU3LCY7_9FLAO|nr:sensor histidine kinase [Flavobacteriaceae bacterium S356]
MAQNSFLDNKVASLKAKIEKADKGEKLVFMDSLCWYTRDKLDYKYDSIVKGTIEYAIQLDSLNLAMRQAARLVWSLSNRLGRPGEAKLFFNEFQNRRLPVKNNLVLARFYVNGGDSYYFSDEVEKSIDMYNIAANYALVGGDSLLFGITKKYTSDAYSKLGHYSESLKLLEEVENIYKKTRDTIRFLNTASSRANLYSLNGFYKEAKKERDNVIELSKKKLYYPGLLSALFNAAIDAGKMGEYKSRINYLNEGLTYANESEELRDQYEPQLLIKLLLAYSQNNDIGKAKLILRKIQKDPDRYTKGLFAPMYMKAYAYYNLSIGNVSKALSLAKIYALRKANSGDAESIMASQILLYKVYEKMGRIEAAFTHYKEYARMEDSISSVQKAQALLYYQTLYESEKRDAKIANQESEITILDSENKLKAQWMLFGGIGLLAIFVIFYLFRTKQFVRGKQSLQATYSRNLIKGQEEERTRLARDLHDSVGQKLMLLTKKAKEHNNDDIDILAENTLEELRSISKGLHPVTLERIGITAAVESMVREIDAHTDIFFTQEIDNIDGLLPKNNTLHVYRIVQESLNNMVKHSKAKSASVAIINNIETIEVIIKDNGIGFDFLKTLRTNKNLGMKTLMERSKIIGAKFRIYTEPTRGTIVELIIPNSIAS